MTKYRVYFTTTVSQWADVEAEDELEAEDLAYEELDGMPFLGYNFDEGFGWEWDSTDEIEEN